MAGSAAVASPFGGVLHEYTLLAEFKLAQKHAAKGLYLAVNPSGMLNTHLHLEKSYVFFFARSPTTCERQANLVVMSLRAQVAKSCNRVTEHCNLSCTIGLCVWQACLSVDERPQ